MLDPAGFSRNLYRTDANASILEIANGRLTHVNFHSAFKVLPHHARADEKGHVWTAGRVISTDYFSDLSGNDAARYIAVIGCAVTFRVRYALTVAHFHAQAFTSVWRQFGPYAGGGALWTSHLAAPEIKVRAFLVRPGESFAGSTITVTTREHPQTVFMAPGSVDPNAEIQMAEAGHARAWNVFHPCVSGETSPNQGLSPGIHTFGFAVLVPRNLFGQNTDNATNPNEDMKLVLRTGVVDARSLAYYAAIHRCRFYARNVSAVALL